MSTILTYVLDLYLKYKYNILGESSMEKDKHLGIRIDQDMHFKLHYISKYEGRSANGQVLYLIRQCINEFEENHGKIEKSE